MHQEAGRHRRNKGLRGESKYVVGHKLSSLMSEDFLSEKSLNSFDPYSSLWIKWGT